MEPEPVSGYDVVGDVHGCASSLRDLLQQLGYRRTHSGWRHHESRKLVFLGDLVDRGPEIRETVLMVREMVEQGMAHVILGNHEFNALTYCTPAPQEFYNGKPYRYDHLRPHTERNTRQIAETLRQFERYQQDWDECLAWFRQLPLLLEFDRFRVVHACWDHERIQALIERNPEATLADDGFLYQSADLTSFVGKAVDRILKGTEIRLPEGMTIRGQDGVRRNRFRANFWSRNPQCYADVVFQPDSLPEHLATRPLNANEKAYLLYYGEEEKPVFVGHYWRQGRPRIIRHNVACLDYSAVKHGRLVAYRMGDDPILNNDGFSWVDVNDLGYS